MRLGFAMLALSVCALGAPRDYKLEEKELFHHTFTGDNTIDVDEVNGSIVVIGDGGNSIRVDADKVIRADTAEAIALGKREVVLDVNEKGGVAQLYVNGPFRENNNDNGHASADHGFHDHSASDHGGRRYEVTYNFTIHVPRALTLQLRSVNGGIEVSDTSGKFEARTINGKMTMTNIAGAGSAETLNGQTTITFRENPKEDCFFKSFNGTVDVGFKPGLSADMHLKTFNGGAFTDFDSTALASAPGTVDRKNGMFVYKRDKESSVRVGGGGPSLRFETFNGSIKIRKLAN